MRGIKGNEKGFTLIEVMITLAIFGIVIGAVFFAYRNQLRAYVVQKDITEMQQNVRTALYLISRELKLAGLDPTGDAKSGITTADAHTITFSMDIAGGANDGIDNDDDGIVDEGSDGFDNNGNGYFDEPDEAEWYNGSTADANERVTYALSNDADSNGRNDGLGSESDTGDTCHILRNGQLLALNIDALNFVYLDEDGNALATPVADTTDIRSVQVCVVGRTGATESPFAYSYRNNQAYQNQRPAPGGPQEILPLQNDSFHRVLMTSEIKCRNMGLH